MKSKLIIIAILSMFTFSCTDLMDKEPLDIVSDEAVWGDADYIKAYLVQLYHRAPTKRLFIEGYNWGYWPQDDNHAEPHDEPAAYVTMSDEARGAYSWTQSMGMNKDGWSRNSSPLQYWDYSLIRSCNEFLYYINKGNLDNSLKGVYAAEARFIRAFVYFELVKRYGGVPIITVPQAIDAPDDELYIKRNTEQEVYDFIIAECDEISKILPKPGETETGRVNNFTALALLSRAGIYAGSIAKYGSVDLNGIVGINGDGQSYFKAAYDAAKIIITQGPYTLYRDDENKAENYRNIFQKSYNSEVIFARQFVGSLYGHSFDAFNAPHLYGAGWGNFINPTLDMVDAYEFIDGTNGKIDWQNTTGPLSQVLAKKDPRLHATIYFNGNPIANDSLELYVLETPDANGVYTVQESDAGGYYSWTNNGVVKSIANVGKSVYPVHRDATKTGFYIKKFLKTENLKSDWKACDADWIEFRLAEIKLNYAEAAVELGLDADALPEINDIRDRAGIAPLQSVNLEQVRHERRVELAFECHRIWDLRRWRIADQVMNNEFHGLNTIWRLPDNTYRYQVFNCDDRESFGASPFARYFNVSRMYYLPITEDRVNNNPKLVENPGY